MAGETTTVLAPGAPGAPGQPGAAGTPPERTPEAEAEAARQAAETRDAEWQAKFDQLQEDINRVKSAKDHEINSLKDQYEQHRQQLETALDEARTASLNDVDKSKYLVQRSQEKLEEANRKIGEANQRMQNADAMAKAMSFFVNAGVPLEELILDQDPGTLAASGYTAMQKQLKAQRDEITQLKANPGASNQQPPKPPGEHTPQQVAGGGTGAPANTNWPELLNTLSTQLGRKVSEEDVWRMVEKGTLNPAILPRPQESS